jgi:crotonobetaine/carnitine-CoA ligase
LPIDNDVAVDRRAAVEMQFAGQDIAWLLDQWAERRPDHPQLVWAPHEGAGRTWTYRQFVDDVRRLGAGLHERGVQAGDKVLIHADNCPEMVLAWYACAFIGAVGVTTNTRSVGAEIAYYAEKAQCVAAVTQPQYAQLVTESAPGLKWIAVAGESFDELYGDVAACPPSPRDPLAPAGIQFTSGTTSKPKAVVHTHGNALWAATVGPRTIDMTSDDTYLVYLPFFHVNAQSWSFWTTLGVGGTLVLQPKFSSSRFWDVVATHGVTHISLIPFVFKAIAGQAQPENHRLRVGVFGLVVPELEQLLKIRVLPAYGMTETVIHAISGTRWGAYAPRSMGRPTPGYDCVVVDRETGDLCGEGQVGELWVRGHRGIQLFLEYFDNPEANQKSFTDDGWFKTGDNVRYESGNWFFSERDKDVLKVGGENVSAREVEDVCRTVAGVGDIAVVAQSHEMLDQVAVAFVIKAPGTDVDDATLQRTLIDTCAAQLADFKVPRAVYVVDSFPTSLLDKVAKTKLREMADELAAATTTEG